jgi:hypothetical protein
MTVDQSYRRTSMAVIQHSPLRFVAAASSITAGFAYVLEAEDQFHRAMWFGILFAAITGLWFIAGSFLCVVDTLAVWFMASGLALGSIFLMIANYWFLPDTASVDDTGKLTEPLTVVRVVLALLVLVASTVTVVMPGWRAEAFERVAMIAGVLTLAIALTATITAALVQSYGSGEKTAMASLSLASIRGSGSVMIGGDTARVPSDLG